MAGLGEARGGTHMVIRQMRFMGKARYGGAQRFKTGPGVARQSKAG